MFRRLRRACASTLATVGVTQSNPSLFQSIPNSARRKPESRPDALERFAGGVQADHLGDTVFGRACASKADACFFQQRSESLAT